MKTLVQQFIIFCLVIFISNEIFAQQGNVWAFGYHSGLDFNYSPPRPISTIIHYPNVTWNGATISSSSISDCRGHLIFYGTNAEIYNRFNNLMPHGHLNLADGSGTVYIVPFPNDTSKYYYFQQLNGSGGGNLAGLYYSIVDMTLDSGRGDVIDTANEIMVNSSINAFALVKNKNDTDYWIICPVKQDTIYVYPLTASGIGPPMREPKKVGFSSRFAQIKGDHKGDKLAFVSVAMSSFIYSGIQYDFNNKYGLLSNPKLFYKRTPPLTNLTDSANLTGIEYSENDSVMYLTSNETDGQLNNLNCLYQALTYNLSDLSKLYTLKNLPLDVTGLQLGPDNAVYWGIPGDSFLNVVRNPDNYGIACHLEMTAIDLRPGYLGGYLPNIYAPVRNLKFNTKDSVCADSIHFANVSDTTYFRSFKWYFGDGDSTGSASTSPASTSSATSPWHAYKKPGRYNVLLVGVNDCGAKLYYSDSVSVFIPAHTGFRIDTVSYSCLAATLKLHKTINDTTQTYSYIYGDNADTVKDSIHVYKSSGTYMVTQLANNGKCTNTISQTIHINIEPEPIPGFNINNNAQCNPYKLQVKNTSQNADKYLWIASKSPKGDLTDTGSIPLSLSDSLSHTPPGTYDLSLITYNLQGCADTLTGFKDILISPRPVPAFTDSQIVVCGGIKTVFTNQSQNANKYLWLFETGSYPDTSLAYVFQKNGSHSVSLIAYNSYCSDTLSKNISINIPVVKAAFSSSHPNGLSGLQTGCPGLAVSFTNQSMYNSQTYKVFKNLIGFKWEFGDNTTDTAANPVHTYSSAGVYSVSLIATSPQGCTDTIINKNYITILPYPKAALAVQDSSVLCAAFRYTFKNLSTNADSFTWNFGDGSALVVAYGSDTGVSHVYKSSGSYNITLMAGNGFCTDSASIHISIFIRPAPVPDFTANSSTVCIGNPVIFKNMTTHADSVLWDFGDGTSLASSSSTSSTGPDTISHIYTKPGRYDISLIAKSKQGCKITLDSVAVIINPRPQLVLVSPQNICSQTAVQLGGISTAGYTYQWTSKPVGFSSNTSNPIDSPGISKTYYLKEAISATGCTDSDSVRISVVSRPDAAFNVKNLNGYKYQFTVQNPNYPAWQYHWHFGDLSSATSAGSATSDTASGYNVSHTYTSNGKYNVVLTVSLPGYCTETDSYLVVINESLGVDVFPNPFSLQTDIHYTLTSPAHVKISMTDDIGRNIGTLIDKQLNQGVYDTYFDGAVWKTRPGMYFVLFQFDDKLIVKKTIQIDSIYY